jgi:hypothetical protein
MDAIVYNAVGGRYELSADELAVVIARGRSGSGVVNARDAAVARTAVEYLVTILATLGPPMGAQHGPIAFAVHRNGQTRMPYPGSMTPGCYAIAQQEVSLNGGEVIPLYRNT